MRADVRRALRIGLVLAAFVAVIAYFTLRNGSKAARPTVPAPIAVVTANARSGDQPIYLTGLGSVVGYKTVTVRTRVDGELVRVAVRKDRWFLPVT